MYLDSDLKFLNKRTEVSKQINSNIVPAEFDDDCNTDDEMVQNAQRMLQKELARGINNYVMAKAEGRALKRVVVNYNPIQRFKRKPWNEYLDDSDDEAQEWRLNNVKPDISFI